MFQKLADAHINIKYTYLATRNRLVIAVDRPEDVMKALGQVSSATPEGSA